MVPESELESVELGRIVRPGDLNAAGDVELVLRPVRERSGNDADVHDVDTAFEQTRQQARDGASSPLGRLSRPTAIAPFTPFSARNAAYARATSVAATSG